MKSNIKILITLLIVNCQLSINNYAQVGVNTDGTDPDASAMMDVKSTTKGVLLPRMTTSERTSINPAATGLLVYDTDLKSLVVYDGSNWIAVRSQLADLDNDTRIWTEQTTDEDLIRFDLNGATRFTSNQTSNAHRISFEENDLVLIGENAGFNTNSSSHSSVVIGNNAAWTTGDKIQGMVAIGHETNRNVEGRESVIIGHEAYGGNTSAALLSRYDVAIGYRAAYQKADGDYNVIVGSQAMAGSGAKGSYNNIIGYQAGYNLDGNYNNIVGFQAGYNLDNSSENNIIGYQAGYNLNGGNYNNIIGNEAATGLIAGDYNVILGVRAGNSLGGGSNNVIIGYEAGKNYTGSGSVLIGYQAGQDATNDNRLYIENSSSTSPLFYGEFDNDYLQINGRLDIAGQYTFRENTFSTGAAIITNGSGIVRPVNSSAISVISFDNSTNTLSFTNGDNDIDLSSYNQTFSLSNNTLTLSNGGSVDLSPYVQTLSLSNNNLSISSGNTVALPSLDNLGNHTLTTTLETNGKWISNDGGNEGIFITTGGNVGINTSSPTAGKLVVSGTNSITISGSYGRMSDNGCGTSNTNSRSNSIWASGGVSADLLFAVSDARIKNIQDLSNNDDDLQTLMDIDIVDYTYIDTIVEGTTPNKKVIAQQVAQVFPQAVDTNNVQVIPNILQDAVLENGWVMSEQSAASSWQLAKGDIVKIIFDEGEELVEVLEVKENAFRIKPSTVHRLAKRPSTVFVYGTQVNNFHVVDYDALKMLNISATQALVKRNEQLEKEQAALEAELEALESQAGKIKALEARILKLKQERVNETADTPSLDVIPNEK